MKTRHNKLVIVIIILMSMIYVGNLLIDNPYTHSIVNYYLNEKILKKLPIRAEYQSMKVALVPPALTIYGLKVTGIGLDGKSTELASGSSMTFKASLWSIFMARPQIGDLELTDLNFSWPPPADFIDALRALEPKPQTVESNAPLWPPTQPPPLSSLKISNASIRAIFPGLSLNANQDPDEVTRISADGLNLDVEIHDWKSFKLDLSSTSTIITDLTSSYVEGGSLKIRGEMQDKKFTTRKLELRSPRLEIDGKADVQISNKPQSRAIDTIALQIQSQQFRGDMSVIGSFLDIPGSRGRITGNTKTNLIIPVASKKPLSFITTGHLKSFDARFFDFRLYETESDFSVDLDKFKLQNINLKVGDFTVAKGQGDISFDKDIKYDFDLVPSNLPFKDLLGIFNVDFDVLNFNLTSPSLRIAGTGDPFNMTVKSTAELSDFTTPTADYNHSRHPESPRCLIDFELLVNSDALNFNRGIGDCRITGKDSVPGKFPLNISGFTSFDTKSGMDIKMNSDIFNPAPLTYFAQASLQGSGSMGTRIHGSYDQVKVDINTDLKDTIIGSTTVGSLSGRVTIDGDKATWSNLKLQTPAGGVLQSSKGQILLNDDLDVDFVFAGKMIDHGVIGAAIRDITDGKSSLEFVMRSIDGHMAGPIMQPLRWKGQLAIDLENARDYEFFYGKSLKGTLKGTKTGYSTEDLVVFAGGTRSDIKFNHTWDPTKKNSQFLSALGLSESDRIDLSGKITAIPKAGDEIRLIPVIGKLAAENGISAQVSGDFKFAGSLVKQTGIARLQLNKSKIADAPVSDILSSIVVDGSKLDIMAEQGGSALKARINLDLGKPEVPFSWYIAAKNADFRPWLPSIMSEDARNYAYLTATWSLQGTLKNWWESKGELELKDLRLRYYSLPSRNGQRFDFRLAQSSRVYFNGHAWILADEKPVTVTSSFGEIRVGLKDHRPPSHLGLKIGGRFDLDALRLFVSDLETASGTIVVDGGITGSIDHPNVDISVKNSEQSATSMDLGLIGYRPSFQNIEIDAHVKYNGITVHKLKANKGNGAILASGFIARPGGGEESDFTLNFDNASFLYPFPIVKYFDSSLDGQIKITGSSRPWTAAGRISIRKARSNRDVDIREAIIESLRSQSTKESTDSISPSVNLDISIAADKSVAFSSRSGQAELSTDLRISGTNLSPSIIGLVDISKGRFFYKRDFEIKRGLINFDDPIQADPSLDISATSDVSSYRVAINITGRASTPSIDFTVDPPTRPDGQALSKMDIIGLLSRGSLPEAQTGRNSSESAAAAEALNLLAGQVEDTVQKIFDLSGQNVIRQVYIDTYADAEGTPVARFNLPLNITDDFDVILKVDQTTVKVSSEYSLHDSISLTGGIESSNDQSGTSSKSSGAPADTGVDLKFKFAFP